MEHQPPAHYEGWMAHAREAKICWNLFGLANHGDYVVNLYAQIFFVLPSKSLQHTSKTKTKSTTYMLNFFLYYLPSPYNTQAKQRQSPHPVYYFAEYT